jgi:hypothetical protein
MKYACFTIGLSIFLASSAVMAGERLTEAEKEARHEAMKKEREEKREARLKEYAEKLEARKTEMAEKKEAMKKRSELKAKIEGTTATEFEKKNSDKDLLRGKITHAMPAKDGESGYTAFIMLRWGDLDNQIPNIKSEYYTNWDGYVKLQQGGKAEVVKEFAFDDRNQRTGGVDKGDGLGRDSGKRQGDRNTVGEGSGHDEIIKDSDISMVAWKSGIVGATDGLLIKLTLKKAETKGTIKAGNFTIPFEITPAPEK